MSSVSITACVHAQTALSQHMMQSLRVLQMNGHELQEFLAEESRDNPFLDVTPPRLIGGSEDPADYAEDTPCLYEDVLRQIHNAFTDTYQRNIALFFAEHLDERGFCPATSEQGACTLECTVDECDAVLRVLRGFEPEGVFSANFWDCISYRMSIRGVSDKECAAVIAALPFVPVKGPDASADNACISRPRFKELLQTVKKLRSPPASHYHRQTVRTRTADCYVALDNDNKPVVSLNADALPTVCFTGSGLNIPKKSHHASDNTALQKNIIRARTICDAVERRSDTLLNIASAVVREQHLFFTLGESYQVPLTLSKIASICGLHESTVSRAAKEKALSFKGKLYDLKFFFGSAAVASAKDGGVSASAAKNRLRNYLDSEDPVKPYSDDVLAELLAKEGICISRRTVMKYRSALGVPSSSSRKRINAANM